MTYWVLAVLWLFSVPCHDVLGVSCSLFPVMTYWVLAVLWLFSVPCHDVLGVSCSLFPIMTYWVLAVLWLFSVPCHDVLGVSCSLAVLCSLSWSTSVSGYSNQQFNPRLHCYVVSLSCTLNLHCFSRLSSGKSARPPPMVTNGVCSVLCGFPEEIALRNQLICVIKFFGGLSESPVP